MNATRALGCFLVFASCASAQEEPPPPEVDGEVKALREEVGGLQRRLKALEARSSTAPVATPTAVVRYGGGKPNKPNGGGIVIELPGRKALLQIDGQVRWRGEYRGDAYGQPKTNSETDFVVQRIRLGFRVEVNEHLGAQVTIQDSRTWGDKLDGLAGARLNSDQPETFLYEGYGVLRNPFGVPLTLKVGRMAVPRLGDQRLISDLDWSHIGRAWDGVQLTYEPKGWWMMAFGHNVREASALPVPGDENDDVWFSGVYVSNRMVKGHELDAFAYFRRIGDNGLITDSSGDRGARKDYTVGLRFKGETGPLFYNGMVAYQFGSNAGDTIAAWAAALQVGGKIKLDATQVFTIAAEVSFASGDPDPNDARVETFDPLLPFAHFHNGHQDLFAWRNVITTNLRLAYSPKKTLSFHADAHLFWLERRDDRWYGLGFSRIDGGNVADDSFVGAELDLYVKWTVIDGHLSFWGGYSHFFTGGYVRDTGPKTSDQDWVFLMATIDF